MKKKKVSHGNMEFCPKNGLPACCAKKREQPHYDDPFDEIDCAVQGAWQVFETLEPSVKDVKQFFLQQLLQSYLRQCSRMGLPENEIRLLLDDELKSHYDKVATFREISEKLRKEKTGYDLA